MTEPQPADRFLRLSEVIDLAGLGKTMIYRKVRAGTFPAPYKPGGASTRWSEREVIAWQQQVKADRCSPLPPVSNGGGDDTP